MDSNGIAEHIRELMPANRQISLKPMFGGQVYLVDGNAAVGELADAILVRVGMAQYDDAVRSPHARAFSFQGRPINEWVAVEHAGLRDPGILTAWIASGVSFAMSLPACPRYSTFPDLRDQVIAALRPGMRVLDVGAGATPTIAPELRPEGVHYVGFDISRDELERAAPGSYDEIRACSALEIAPDLLDKFDMIVTLQTLEHIRPLDLAIDNLRRYLKPGGQFFGQMTGTFTYFSLLNRIAPTGLKNATLRRIHRRRADDIFPAYYHHCWHGALRRAFKSWDAVNIEPYYTGGGYLSFSSLAFRLYLTYENWAARNDHRNLASHYIVHAVH